MANFRTNLKTLIKEAGAPGKIETGVKKPEYSNLPELKSVMENLGFQFMGDTLGGNLHYTNGYFHVYLYNEPVLVETKKNGIKIFSNNAHKAYIQWNIIGGGVDIRGLTAGELFLAIKG